MTKYYVTKNRHEELQKELEELKSKKRLEIAERLKRAKEYGDISENSEYSEAKDEQAQVERRIFELEIVLKDAVIIKKAATTDEVRIGSTVKALKGDKEVAYQIVGSNEAMPEEGRISNESPLGSAFLGKKVGETVGVQTPNGSIEYKIVGIE